MASNPNTIRPRRNEPHTIIIARGDSVRHFQITPWMAGVVGSALAAVAISYLAATSYLVLRDDIIEASSARNARLQQEYEDRISALRSQVDRITSRQMLDQQLVQNKVGELLARQSYLTEMHERLEQTTGTSAGLPLPQEAPVAPQKPELRAGLAPDALSFAGTASSGNAFASLFARPNSGGKSETNADRSDRLFSDIKQSLRAIETAQVNRVNELAQNAYQTADAISSALQGAGLDVANTPETGIGGPLVPLENPALLDTKMRELEEALDLAERMKTEARRLPISNPSPGHGVSSDFGFRRDPILGTPALHSGMDFRAPLGAEILAAGEGTVVKAGWNGGYGRMVEIRHADGFSTRYAHMSSIEVEEGQQVSAGDVVGKSGSTGRSTGPHLHYEVHRDGKPLNPARFISAGQKIRDYL